jgi:pimeloyl-ACP methyl ester carboxylesterase
VDLAMRFHLDETFFAAPAPDPWTQRKEPLPGAEAVLPWLCSAGRRSVAPITQVLGRIGLRASSELEEIWRSFRSLEESAARHAFVHTVRGLIDLGGQRVSASDRLYLAGDLPTLIVWGERDR